MYVLNHSGHRWPVPYWRWSCWIWATPVLFSPQPLHHPTSVTSKGLSCNSNRHIFALFLHYFQMFYIFTLTHQASLFNSYCVESKVILLWFTVGVFVHWLYVCVDRCSVCRKQQSKAVRWRFDIFGSCVGTPARGLAVGKADRSWPRVRLSAGVSYHRYNIVHFYANTYIMNLSVKLSPTLYCHFKTT